MDKNIIKGNWNKVKGKLKHFWGRVTNDELDEIEGNVDELTGSLQTKYGHTKDEVKKKTRKRLSKLKKKTQVKLKV